jgi:hypothetical protein
MDQNQKHVVIPAALAQACVDYLKKQPYEQVFQLVAGLVQAPAFQPAPAPAPAPALAPPPAQG